MTVLEVIVSEPVDALFIAAAVENPEAFNVLVVTVTEPLDALLIAAQPVDDPPVIEQEVILRAAVELFLNAKMFAADPPTIVKSERVSVPLVAVTSKQMVVPARKFAVICRTVDMMKLPPAAAPAGVLAAVERVARALASPVPLPTPVARKTVPAVLEEAPMFVHVVVPTKVISYHWPETREPVLTVGLLAPPMVIF